MKIYNLISSSHNIAGEPLLLSGPAGSFDAHSVCSAKTLVLIAAGSG